MENTEPIPKLASVHTLISENTLQSMGTNKLQRKIKLIEKEPSLTVV